LARNKLKSLKPEPAEIKSVDAMEEGQRILANIIARAYLRNRKERQAESQPDCNTKKKRCRNNESLPGA
jgi:hypothetical protein